MNQELNNWILQARSTGHADDQIKQYLVSHGYTSEQIEDAFVDLTSTEEQPDVSQDIAPITDTEDSIESTETQPQAIEEDKTQSIEPNESNETEQQESIETPIEPEIAGAPTENTEPKVDPEPTLDTIEEPELVSEQTGSNETDVNQAQETESSDAVSLNFGATNKSPEQQLQEISVQEEEEPTQEIKTQNQEQDIQNIEQQIDSIYEPDNHQTNYTKKSSVIPTILFLILVLGGVFGAYYYYTNYMTQSYVEPELVIQQSIPEAKIIPKIEIEPEPEIIPEPLQEPEPITIEPEPEMIPEPIELPEPQEPIEPETLEDTTATDK